MSDFERFGMVFCVVLVLFLTAGSAQAGGNGTQTHLQKFKTSSCTSHVQCVADFGNLPGVVKTACRGGTCWAKMVTCLQIDDFLSWVNPVTHTCEYEATVPWEQVCYENWECNGLGGQVGTFYDVSYTYGSFCEHFDDRPFGVCTPGVVEAACCLDGFDEDGTCYLD